MANVTFHESRSYLVQQRVQEIADKIKDCGYELANISGSKLGEKKLYEYGVCVIGILEPRPGTDTKKQKYFLGLLEKEIQVPKKSHWLGALWIEHFNQEEQIKYDKRWVLDVYGRENIPKLMEFAKKISEPYNVSVDMHIKSEEVKLEERPDDKDYSIGFNTIMSILCDAEL